jgi:hypothetical protein
MPVVSPVWTTAMEIYSLQNYLSHQAEKLKNIVITFFLIHVEIAYIFNSVTLKIVTCL